MQPLPHALGPEKSILSSMMQRFDKVDEGIELGIKKESFHIPAHQEIFKLLEWLRSKSKSWDLISLTQFFTEKGLIQNLGGPSELTSIYTYAPTDAHFKHHCKIVIEKFRLREIISRCSDAIELAYEDPQDVDAFLDSVEAAVFNIDRGYELKKEKGLKALLEASIQTLQDFIEGKNELVGLPTRFKVLNDLTKGLCKGDLIIIAARPSMGKTALMCNLIEDLTVLDVPGMAFSLEMRAQQLVDRILFGRASFPMHYLKHGFKPTKEELKRIFESFKDLVDKNLFIDDSSQLKINELRSKARRAKKEYDIQYVAIDYIQLMSGSKKYEGREREISEISAGLKALAKELEIPVIVLAQLNRNPEKRPKNEPKLSDLRESGSLEQDGDIVGLLYRPDYYGEEQEDGNDEEEKREGEKMPAMQSSAELIIAKNRNGPVGSVSMKFRKDVMKFS